MNATATATTAVDADMAACTEAPKLDPRVRRTRRLLEDAMRALLAERSYDAISVGDIAERATVNRATFYAHFQDKRDLTAALLRHDLEATLLASIPARPAPLDARSLGTVAAAVFAFVTRTHAACPRVPNDFSAHVGPTLQETVQSFLRTWLARDPAALRACGYPLDADRDAVATVLAWSLYGAALRWMHLPNRPPAERAAREVVALLVRTGDGSLQ